MVGLGFRYTDLWPDVPMADDSNCLEIYADSVADLRLHGPNFMATYFVWGRRGPHGLVQRVPVVKIIRPHQGMVGIMSVVTSMMAGNTQSIAAH